MIYTWIRPFSVVTTALALILAGCGGDDSDASVSLPLPPIVDIKPIMVIDGFSVASLLTTTHIDLTSYIQGGEGNVTAVAYFGDDADNCVAPIINGMGFDVTAQSGALCDYDFTVNNAQTHARAVMTVLATKAEKPVLSPLSLPLVLDTTPIATSINLTDNEWLGSDYPAGYILKSVSVQGGDDNLGAVAVVTGGTTITYTPPTLSGWNRLVYTLKNNSKPDEDIIGSVYVTISESINQPPTIIKPSYDYNAENKGAIVLTRSTIDINLGSGFITEPDSQDWQVIEAQSYTGSVNYKNPNSVTNKVLTFTAATIGDHVISYVVADEFGGYSVGMVKVTVTAKEQAAMWTALTVEDNSYIAPLRYSQAIDNGLQVNPLWDNPINNTIAGFNIKSAQLYCGTIGTIPSIADMTALRDAHYTAPTTTGDLNKWPAVKPYLVLNETGTDYLGFNVETGITTANLSGTYYVTCIANPNLTLTMINRQVLVNNEITRIATIRKPINTDIILIGVPTGEPIDLTAAQANLKLVTNGSEITVVAQSTKSGVYRFKILNNKDDNDAIASPIINYIADIKTAELKKLAVDVNDAASTNKAENKVTAMVLDAYDNPVQEQTITVTLTENGAVDNSATLINPENALFTDLNGKVNLSIKNSEDEVVTVSVNYRAPDSSLIGDSQDEIDITFTPPSYCYLFPEAKDLNCLPYVVNDNGQIFTASTSTDFYLLGGATYVETGTSGNKGVYNAFSYPMGAGFCVSLTTNSYLGRKNWRSSTELELTTLYNQYGNMYKKNGWPTGLPYIAANNTSNPSSWIQVSLADGSKNESSAVSYQSCTSQ